MCILYICLNLFVFSLNLLKQLFNVLHNNSNYKEKRMDFLKGIVFNNFPN